jgi:hypothetical protein
MNAIQKGIPDNEGCRMWSVQRSSSSAKPSEEQHFHAALPETPCAKPKRFEAFLHSTVESFSTDLESLDSHFASRSACYQS